MVNNIRHTVETNQFSLYDYPSGTYGIRVRAVVSDTEQSVFSPTLTVVIDREFEHPKNVYVSRSANELRWSTLSHTTGYKVFVNSIEYETTTNVFDLSFLDENAVYELYVKAVYENGVSQESLSVWHHTYTEVVDTFNITFNKLQGRDVRLPIADDFELEFIFFMQAPTYPNLMIIEDGILSIDFNLLEALEVNTYTYELITSEGLYHLVMNVVAEQKPFLISSNVIEYDEENIVLEYELFGGTFESLSGANITSSDYTFSNSVLTINASFIESLLVENPERKTVILGYQLKAGEHITIGYIFINIPQD